MQNYKVYLWDSLAVDTNIFFYGYFDIATWKLWGFFQLERKLHQIERRLRIWELVHHLTFHSSSWFVLHHFHSLFYPISLCFLHYLLSLNCLHWHLILRDKNPNLVISKFLTFNFNSLSVSSTNLLGLHFNHLICLHGFHKLNKHIQFSFVFYITQT
jgi:hypothetical protein